MMKTRSRRYNSSAESIDNAKAYELQDAIEGLSKQSKVKFDESIELSFSLGVDPKQTSQSVRGTVNLPHGSGKDVKVLVLENLMKQQVWVQSCWIRRFNRKNQRRVG